MSARVAALDLSLTGTGYSFSGPDDDEYTGTITPPAKLRGGARLDHIITVIDTVAFRLWGDLPPTHVIVEDLPIHAKSAGLTAQVHGAFHFWSGRRGWPVAMLVPPATLKTYATGKGNADKVQMVVAARDRLGYEGTNDNEADAMWLNALAYHLAGQPIVDLPRTHLRALAKLDGTA